MGWAGPGGDAYRHGRGTGAEGSAIGGLQATGRPPDPGLPRRAALTESRDDGSNVKEGHVLAGGGTRAGAAGLRKAGAVCRVVRRWDEK